MACWTHASSGRCHVPRVAMELVPEERFRPYRSCEPTEVDAIAGRDPGAEVKRLRTMGQGQARMPIVGVLGSVA